MIGLYTVIACRLKRPPTRHYIDEAFAKEVSERLQQQQQQVAAKTADPQAQAVKETLAAI